MSKRRSAPSPAAAAPSAERPPLTTSEHAARVLAATASTPLPLDSFLARIGAASPPPTQRRHQPAHAAVAPLALFDASTEAAPQPQRVASSHPLALILPIEEVTCDCGTVTRCVTSYVLVRYAVNEHSFHHRRETLTDAMRRLPRQRQVFARRVPYCESCFDASDANAT